MANLQVKDATATTQEVKATGVGSAGDPFIVEHLETNSAAILTAASAIQAAVEILDNIVSGSEAQVDVLTSALPSGAATAANQSTGNTALSAIQTAVQIIDDALNAMNTAFSKAVAIGGQFDNTAPTAATEDNVAPVRITAQRALHINLRNASGTEISPATAANQSTGNTALSAIQTAVQIMDDWDESDRAKVNLIAGQAGITAGAGAVGASTPRVTLASDDPAVAALQTLDNIVAGSEAQVDIVTMPAQDRATDNVGVALQVDALMEDTTVLTPKFAIIDAASSGDNTLVAAVSGERIRVLSLYLVASAAVTVRFEDGAGGTALSGQLQLAANGGFVLPFNPVGWFETGVNTLLNLELSGAISVDGGLTYVEV